MQLRLSEMILKTDKYANHRLNSKTLYRKNDKYPDKFITKWKFPYHHFATTVLRLHWKLASKTAMMTCVVACAFAESNMAHNRFLARTVMVGEGGASQALRALQRVLTDEKVIKDIQLKRYYEKPTVKRRRLKYESSLKLYNSEMKRKVDFLMDRQRKVTPWT